MYRMVSDVELKRFRAFMKSGIPTDYFGGPEGAYDSKPRRARDQEEGEEPEEEPKGRSAIDILLDLKDRMSKEGFRALCEALMDKDDDEGEMAGDEPPDFVGRPNAGGKISGGGQGEPTAMDSKAAADYRTRFPDAPSRTARHEPEAPKPARRSTAADRAYSSRFPDASRIG